LTFAIFNADNLYRPLQRDVIVAALAGDDVFVQAATGFGKSLCFQLPAVIDHGSELPFDLIFSTAYLTSSSHYRHISTSSFDGIQPMRVRNPWMMRMIAN
jgi:hypothetical protein